MTSIVKVIKYYSKVNEKEITQVLTREIGGKTFYKLSDTIKWCTSNEIVRREISMEGEVMAEANTLYSVILYSDTIHFNNSPAIFLLCKTHYLEDVGRWVLPLIDIRIVNVDSHKTLLY